MRKNIDEAYRKQVIEFIVNFLGNEGFSNISRPETDETPALSIEDRITEKNYHPSLSAQKDDQIYLIEVETDGNEKAQLDFLFDSANQNVVCMKLNAGEDATT